MERSYGDNTADSMVTKWWSQVLTNGRYQMPVYPAPDANLIDNSKVEPIKILSSEDFGDPTLHEVLQWHMRICILCKFRADEPPPAFGKADTRHCQDYFAIIQDYSDYERDYASKGNP